MGDYSSGGGAITLRLTVQIPLPPSLTVLGQWTHFVLHKHEGTGGWRRCDESFSLKNTTCSSLVSDRQEREHGGRGVQAPDHRWSHQSSSALLRVEGTAPHLGLFPHRTSWPLLNPGLEQNGIKGCNESHLSVSVVYLVLISSFNLCYKFGVSAIKVVEHKC